MTTHAERQRLERLEHEVAALRAEVAGRRDVLEHIWGALAALAVGFERRGSALHTVLAPVLERRVNADPDDAELRARVAKLGVRLESADALEECNRLLREISAVLQAEEP